MDEKEFNNVYAIPANYTDSGKLLGGLLETRNTVEAVMLVMLVGYPQLKWLSLPFTTKLVVMVVTLLPLGIAALMGISGGSLFQFVAHIVRHFTNRRKITFRRVDKKHETGKKAEENDRKPKEKDKRKRSGFFANKRHSKRHHRDKGRPICEDTGD